MRRLVVIGLLEASLLAGSASATILVTSGVIDNTATALSGRKGSASGPFTLDPPPEGGTNGAWDQTAAITAGPVLPVDDNHPSLPGTRGVVTANGRSRLAFTPGPGMLAITASASASATFTDMDGGSYLGTAASAFESRFTLGEPTPWTLAGTASFHPEDVLGSLRLTGPFGTYAFLTRAGNGAFSLGGVLPAGDYLFAGNTYVYEVPQVPGNSGHYTELSTVQATLTLLPEPTSLLIGLASAALLLSGRR